MQIVWHGEYVRYFEDGREAFGKRYGLDYMSIYREGYLVPIVDLSCQFKQPLSFGEEAIVETRYIHSDAAKILFEYTIYRASDQYIVATGTTTQVFLNTNRELELVNPAFLHRVEKEMEHHLTTYITHDTLISALGFGTQENLEAIRSYHSGITLQTDKRIADTPLLAATLSQDRLQQQAEAIGVVAIPGWNNCSY